MIVRVSMQSSVKTVKDLIKTNFSHCHHIGIYCILTNSFKCDPAGTVRPRRKDRVYFHRYWKLDGNKTAGFLDLFIVSPQESEVQQVTLQVIGKISPSVSYSQFSSPAEVSEND